MNVTLCVLGGVTFDLFIISFKVVTIIFEDSWRAGLRGYFLLAPVGLLVLASLNGGGGGKGKG